MITVGSLFSGIGGLELGLEQEGIGTTIWQAEADPFCRRILSEHWPEIPIYDNVELIDETTERPTILIGGFPCQDVSVAGSKAGLAGHRSGLWYEFLRIIRLLRPPIVVVENVPGLLVRGFDEVLGGLAAERYDAEWRVYGACDVGAPHLRKRLFVVATQSALPDAERDELRLKWQRQRQQHELQGATVASFDGQELAYRFGLRPQGLDRSGSAPTSALGSDPSVADTAGQRFSGGTSGSGWEEGTPAQRHALADGDGGRRESLGIEGPTGHRGEQRERGDEPHRRDLPQWPPSPDDVFAWGSVPAEAQPAVCRLADGFSPGLDWIVGPPRRQALQAYGNAVVPPVAALVGRKLVIPALKRLIGEP